MYGPGDYFDEKRSHALGSIIGKVKKALTKNESDVVCGVQANQEGSGCMLMML